MPQVRLNKTPELEKVLTFFQRKYRLLSEAEIIKVALSEKYAKELENELEVRDAYNRLMTEGKKLGDKLLKEKGLRRKDITEELFYNQIIDPHNK